MNTWERYDHGKLISTLNSIIESRKIIRQQVYENRGFTPAQISELQKESTGGFDVEENIRKLMERGFTREVASQAMRVSNNDFNRALTNLLGSKTTSVVEDINENVGKLDDTTRGRAIRDVLEDIRTLYGDVDDLENKLLDAGTKILKFTETKFNEFMDIGRIFKNTTSRDALIRSPTLKLWTINSKMSIGLVPDIPRGVTYESIIYIDLPDLLLESEIVFKDPEYNEPVELSNNRVKRLSRGDRIDLLKLLVASQTNQTAVYTNITSPNKKEILDTYIGITKQASGVDPTDPYPAIGKNVTSAFYKNIIVPELTAGTGNHMKPKGKGRPTKSTKINKELGRQYELLAGTYEAGNKSIQVKRDLKGVINKLHDNKIITPEDFKKELTKYKLNNIKL